ncbi:MAG: phosphomethylpyrimidine synthase ThiC [Armatimonadetes bacterium]|nr:phosphomethylpyrimidine synthase ThiC [Armatimonadota bacterium]NIM24031.1 phosphomethylpyrimidine synthase ThiC [Armatimonadota bacterium]NIM67881.1 phosphomethylpyrimidine synthase ThiC [Armatimonadota bacterium]NIM76409.1 phosphomethylpyrimidine synthase ThiC [Armatimonadota bacterium]NIN06111.1 phosphomethylpyrimidine synthase ThiC [Armatimonadota bacterium]
MTQFEAARSGNITPEMKQVAAAEGIFAEELRAQIAAGRVVIPANHNHANLQPIGIGTGLRVKVNANLGTSEVEPDAEGAKKRLMMALEAKADTVMDLSTAGGLDDIRRALIGACPAPFGTVPIYQAAVAALKQHGDIASMTEDDLFEVIARQAEDGVDFITVHCGVNRESVRQLESAQRLCGVVSRGGAFTICWMRANQRENPLFESFDRLLEIAREHDVTLSLGDGLRPGALADGTDRPQVTETIILGELAERCRAAGVQVMIEGPGHLPLDQVAANVRLQKSICQDAPFYVLGPIVTDIAPGYDHITSAIGGAVAAMAGADFLCYVTPAEHLGLPNAEEVREGVMAARIAAHAADVVRLGEKARAWDNEMARARNALDWQRQFELAIDPEKARRGFRPAPEKTADPGGCSMCGGYCVFSLLQGEEAASGRQAK